MSEMKIVKVIPIANGVFKDSLTYFTSKDIEVGSLVSIPVRNKKIPGILEDIKSVEDSKMDIKNSEYELKKIEKVSEKNIFLKEFVEAAKETAEYFATNAGQVINMLTPNAVLANYENHGNLLKQDIEEIKIKKNPENKFEVFVTQTYFDERMSYYKSLIREEFAKKNSVFLCVPTVHDINIVSKEISKGIEKYSIVFNPGDSKKTTVTKWQNTIKENHPIVIIGTPLFLSIPREDIGTFIIEKESSPAYRSIMRPHIDFRIFAEIFAQKRSAKIVLGDSVLRIETMNKKEKGIYVATHLFKYRYEGRTDQKIIDMRAEREEKRRNDIKNFEILSNELFHKIKRAKEDGEKTFLLCSRRGLATTTVCSDCGTMVTCKKCGGPVVLHKEIKYNIFMCHKCGYQNSAETLCSYCNSWRLFTMGIGTEKTEEEIKEKIPGVKTFLMDSDYIKSYKQGKDVIDAFMATEGAVLIGTEMAGFYLSEKIENVAVVSVDSLFTIPDFKMKEKIFGNLINLRMLATKSFLIQTRFPEDPMFKDIIHGDVLEFYRKDLEKRTARNYPPAKTLIKISHGGKNFEAEKEMGELAKFLNPWKPEVYTSFSKQKDKDNPNILLRLEPENWPKNAESLQVPINDEDKMDLIEILRSLPPRFLVKVDPESIL